MKQFKILLSVSIFTLFSTQATANMAPIISYLLSDTATETPGPVVNMAPIISYLLSDTAPVGPTAKELAIAKIGAYADDQGNTAPTVQDYTDAGATGVDVNNLDTINNAIAGLTASDVDTTVEIQAVIDANSNAQPVANAGPLQEVLTSGIVTLDANSSADTDGDVLTYLWGLVSKPIESNVTLSDTTAIYPTFLADKAGTYDFSLVVNDGNLNSESDTVSIIASHTAGVLDTTFDADGIVVHNDAAGGNSFDEGIGMALDSFGNVYVVGYSVNNDNPVNDDMVIWKYNSNGILDATFGSGGIVTHGDASGNNKEDRASDIALDILGNIYVVGYSVNDDLTENKDMVIWKYTSNGSLDMTFNTTGIVVHHNAAGGFSDDEGSEIALDDAGNIYITGYSKNSSNDDMVIWKYDNTGSLDTNFGTNGIVVHNNAAGGNSEDRGSDILLDDAGNIYITGYSRNSSNSGTEDMVIWKYDNTGSLDTNFGTNGIVVDNGAAGGNASDQGRGIVLDSLGNIYVTGYSNNNAGDDDMVIWKYSSNGVLESTFADEGIVVYTNETGNGYDQGNAISLDSLGNIYVAGWSNNDNNNDYDNDNDMAIWKYDSNGTLDSTFGVGGIVVDHNAAGGNDYDQGNGILLDTLGNIYVTGWSTTTVDFTYDMVIWKYK